MEQTSVTLRPPLFRVDCTTFFPALVECSFIAVTAAFLVCHFLSSKRSVDGDGVGGDGVDDDGFLTGVIKPSSSVLASSLSDSTSITGTAAALDVCCAEVKSITGSTAALDIGSAESKSISGSSTAGLDVCCVVVMFLQFHNISTYFKF